MKPRIPLTDPAFKYVNAASTDVRATFAKARRRLAEEAKRTDADFDAMPVTRTMLSEAEQAWTRKVTELRRKA